MKLATRPSGMPSSKAPPKPKYHHGDLREALIDASYKLVCECGADKFSLADACRLAGVSTAAPYKHFKDRDEVLAIIVTRGFEELAERSDAAVAAAGVGTLPGIVAMGHAYLHFAIDQQSLFRLMFGQHPVLKKNDLVTDEGNKCFGGVIEQVARYCANNEFKGDPREIAVRLWTFVHGAAALVIDEDYEKVAPGLDVESLITSTTPLLLEVGS